MLTNLQQPDPSLAHLGRYPLGTVRAAVVRSAIAQRVPRLDIVALGRTLKPYPRVTYKTRPRRWDVELFGPMPRISAPRRGGHRASRVARVTARRTAAKAAAGGDSGDGDGEPPAGFFSAIVTPAIDDVVETVVVRGPTETAVYFRGIGAMFVSEIAGRGVVEAVAIKGLGVEARHAWLLDAARTMFGSLDVRGTGLLS